MDIGNLNDSENSFNPQLTHVFKLGLDVNLHNVVTATPAAWAKMQRTVQRQAAS